MSESVTTSVETRGSNALQTFVDGRRFAWINLGCGLSAAALWYVSDGRLGPWPLLVALPPWLMRLAAGRFPFKRTRFDLLIWAFLASAAVAVWAAYDRTLAWEKFWLIVGATILFYALAGQRSANLWPIVTGLALSGGMVGLYFLATHDFVVLPAKIGAIDRLGLRLMEIRPAALGALHSLHPNVAGGIIAMLFPFSLAGLVRGARKRRTGMMLASALAAVFMSVGLAFTTSRGAWLALGGGLFIWLLWRGSAQFAETLFLTRRKSFIIGLLVLCGIGLSLVLLAPGGAVGLLERMPGPASAGSRLEIVADAIDMAGDFWITGGGLSSFDGLYSQYIRVIPHHALIHGHNLYLNIVVEQGMAGLLIWLCMLLAAFWWLTDPEQSAHRRSVRGFTTVNGATLAALTIVCLHGFVEDPLYGSRGVLLLWIPLALVAFLFPLRRNWAEAIRSINQTNLVAVGIATFLVAVILVAYRSQVLSAWQANLGAMEMARVELANYPTGEWSDGREASALAPAKARFERSLLFNQNNRTAWHRLGLIAMLERDYESAKDSLYSAYLLDRGHDGIRKALMYSYIWTDNIPQALPLMTSLPETEAELDAYQWWWAQQGHPELSKLAEDARIQLQSFSPNQN